MSALTSTYGCMFIALFFTLILHGIVLILGAQYFRLYPTDPIYVKLTVTALLIIGNLHAVSVFVWAYESMVNHFGMFVLLDVIPPTAVVQLLCIFVLAFISQCFFATRIWILSKKKVYLAGPVFILALLQLGTASVQSARVGILDHFSMLNETNNLVILEQCATVACDLMITGLLCTLLHTSRSGMKATDDMITKLMIYAVNRGVATSVLAITSLVLFLYSPDTFLFLLALLPTGQLYIINVLATLHSRQSLRDNYKSQGAHTLPAKGNAGPSYRIGLLGSKGSLGGSTAQSQSSNDGETSPTKSTQKDIESGVHVATSVVNSSWDGEDNTERVLAA